MIRMLICWGITRIKVNIKSISFWLITALMALAFLLSRSVAGQYNEDTSVLVYTGEESSEAADECFGLLSGSEPEGIKYERVYDEDELKRRVSISEASCGVVFEGLTDDLHVTIYQSAGSADGYVIREMVYPVIARLDAEDELMEYVNRVAVTDLGSILTGEAGESARYAAERYRMYTQTLDTGIYEVHDIGNSSDTDPDRRIHEERTSSILRLVLCGMIILTTILSLYDTIHTDGNFYRAFSHGKRVAFIMVRVLTTIVMSTALSMGIYKLLMLIRA